MSGKIHKLKIVKNKTKNPMYTQMFREAIDIAGNQEITAAGVFVSIRRNGVTNDYYTDFAGDTDKCTAGASLLKKYIEEKWSED